MSPEYWRRLQEAFAAVRGQAPEERPGLLALACGGDEALREDAERMLAADQAAGNFMEEAVAAALEDFGPVTDQHRPGGCVGAYRLLYELGRGGMSTVFLAVRADQEYQQQVAVKVIKRGMDSDEIERRFRQERQILANLDHPNIARLVDGGTTDSGQPYFVMEAIEGLAIDDHSARRQLPVAARLELVRTVCSAVHYAHQNLVVHRDLKPGNILITEQGVPKLLDFGIAKLLEPEDFPQTVIDTSELHRVMTPDYASPEQILGGALTTASDIYSLGILLYELLTSRRPYRLDTRRPAEVEQRVCVEAVAPPSTVCQGRLRQRLRGDLDNIVLKALSKEPRRRYASAEQLSDDLRRHLAGLPVIARRDTLSYRAGKFISRNRRALTAVSLGWLVLVASLVQTRIERTRAERQRDRAEQSQAFLEGLFEVSDPASGLGRTITARELLARGAEMVAQQPADQPELQADLMETIGGIQMKLGLYEPATALLGQALELRRHALGDDHPAVAESMNSLATVYYHRGDYGSALPLYRQTLDLRQRLHGPRHPLVAQSLLNLSAVLQRQGDFAAAQPILRRAIELKSQLLGEDEPTLAQARNNLATLLYQKGDVDAALPLYRQVLATKRRLHGEAHPDLARSLNNLAKVLSVHRSFDEAEALYLETVAMKERLLGRDHPDLAVSLNGLASVLQETRRGAEAERLLRRSLELQRHHLPPEHPAMAATLLGLGSVLLDRGQATVAEPLLREAVHLRRQALRPDHWWIAQAESALGACLAAIGRRQEARQLLVAASQALEHSRGADDAETRRAQARLRSLEADPPHARGR